MMRLTVFQSACSCDVPWLHPQPVACHAVVCATRPSPVHA
jgi:hypothetical protein